MRCSGHLSWRQREAAEGTEGPTAGLVHAGAAAKRREEPGRECFLPTAADPSSRTAAESATLRLRAKPPTGKERYLLTIPG